MMPATTVPLTATQSHMLASLTVFDWFLIAVVGVSTVAAFVRGLIRSLFSVAGIVVGILLASWYHAAAAAYLTAWIPQPGIAQFVAFVLIVLAVIVLAWVLGRLTRSACDAVGLGFMDRLGGAVFGFLRGCLLVTAVMMPLAAFLPRTTLLDGSQLSPYFLTGAHGVSFVVPNDFKDRITEGARRLQQSSQSWLLRAR